jgi:hypothetical protein
MLTESYLEGFRNGRLDNLLEINLTITKYSNISGYSDEYCDSQISESQSRDDQLLTFRRNDNFER